MHVEEVLSVPLDRLTGIDIDLSRLALDGDALASKIDKLYAAYLKRRIHWRCLKYFALKAFCRGSEFIEIGEHADMLGKYFAEDVLGGACQSQFDAGEIALVVVDKILARLDSGADHYRKNTRCHRVKRAAMSDLLFL